MMAELNKIYFLFFEYGNKDFTYIIKVDGTHVGHLSLVTALKTCHSPVIASSCSSCHARQSHQIQLTVAPHNWSVKCGCRHCHLHTRHTLTQHIVTFGLHHNSWMEIGLLGI